MRGFSTIELLLSLMIFTLSMVAASQAMYGAPRVIGNAWQARELEEVVTEITSRALRRYKENFFSHVSIGELTSGTLATFHELRLPDDHSILFDVETNWEDPSGRVHSVTNRSLVVDPILRDDSYCSPFYAASSSPHSLASYTLAAGSLLPLSPAGDTYPVSSLALAGHVLAIGVRAGNTATSSTLFFADEHKGKLTIRGERFDIAPASTVGVSAIAGGKGVVFVGNGFGSASAQTCAISTNCAQVVIYSIPSQGIVTTQSSISLPKGSVPWAATVSGASASVKSLAYRRGYLYVGLEKTGIGYEFVIVDVHDLQYPKYIGGLRIGRSVNDITLLGDTAYLATSDSSAELITVNIENPALPMRTRSWDAPGSPNFGLGSVVSPNGDFVLLGRTFVNNSAELLWFPTESSTTLASSSADIGTVSAPASVFSIVSQYLRSFVLSSRGLEVWNTYQNGDLIFKSAIPLTTSTIGSSLICAGTTLYVGGARTTDSAGTIDVIATE